MADGDKNATDVIREGMEGNPTLGLFSPGFQGIH